MCFPVATKLRSEEHVAKGDHFGKFDADECSGLLIGGRFVWAF